MGFLTVDCANRSWFESKLLSIKLHLISILNFASVLWKSGNFLVLGIKVMDKVLDFEEVNY